MACAVSIQLLNYAAGKASTIISTTAGARTFWKRVGNGCLATRFAKPALDEVVDLKKENANLKQAVAELCLRNDWLKKSLTGQDVMLDED